MDELRLDPVQSWLKSWGFNENPFGVWEAAKEQPWLGRYFVRRPFYEQLLTSHSSALIFSNRGNGKSALRLMLQSECQPALTTSTVLAVEFTEFSVLAEKIEETKYCTLKDYVPLIIDCILRRMLLAAADSYHEDFITSPTLLGEWHYWIDQQAPYLLRMDAQAIFHSITTALPQMHTLEKVEALWKQILTTPALPPVARLTSSTLLLRAFVDFVIKTLASGSTPCQVIYLLVDGIDEYSLTQDDPAMTALMLKPLLADLRFLEIPALAVKFFLPNEQRAELEVLTRLDRIQVYTLDWNDKAQEDLRSLLRRRISAFNTVGLQTLDELCAPNLRHWIEDELLKESRGSPRNLLRLGNLLFAEHCRDFPPPESELTLAEWEAAVQRYRLTVLRKAQPLQDETPESDTQNQQSVLLHVDLESGRVYIGGVELREPFSEQEYRLLAFLYKRRGKIVSKDEIRWHVLTDEQEDDVQRSVVSSTITDEHINTMVHRLRLKLRAHTRCEYLKTIPRRGILLEYTL